MKHFCPIRTTDESIVCTLILIGSPTTGVVQVKVLNTFGEPVSTNTVPFEYIEKKEKYKEELQEFRSYLDEKATSSDVCIQMAGLLFEKMREFDSNSKGGANCNGKYKFQLIRVINSCNFIPGNKIRLSLSVRNF